MIPLSEAERAVYHPQDRRFRIWIRPAALLLASNSSPPRTSGLGRGRLERGRGILRFAAQHLMRDLDSSYL